QRKTRKKIIGRNFTELSFSNKEKIITKSSLVFTTHSTKLLTDHHNISNLLFLAGNVDAACWIIHLSRHLPDNFLYNNEIHPKGSLLGNFIRCFYTKNFFNIT